tara:strand:- start:52 stop:909 length:858 start_codon:yes stop_codon:yes gene_type:complete
VAGSLLSVDLEDFTHDLQHRLGLDPTTRPEALRRALGRIKEIVEGAPGSNRLTFFSTGQVARDHGDILRELVDEGHEIGCHGFYQYPPIHEMGRERFSRSLDKAIKAISQASGQPVNGFRAPGFSIRHQDDWAYEELAKRFLYDSSWVSDTRDNPTHPTDVKVFGGDHLAEFPVFQCQLFPGFKARVIGGTYLKVLPLRTILKLMHRAIEEGFLPLIYVHPYEFLHEGEFWVSNEELGNLAPRKKAYWQIRQHQWLSMGNKRLARKLAEILRVFPHQGVMAKHVR